MTDENLYLDFEKPILEIEKKIEELKKNSNTNPQTLQEIQALKNKCTQIKNQIYLSLTSLQKVQIARHPKRPYTLDYVNLIFSDFIELHGDRCFADDKGIITGIAFFNDEPVSVVGHQKGRTMDENIERNFGMMHPEGYRKALRIFKLSEKFSRPIISFIDTPGAFPGIGAEERGQAEAIAKNLREMAQTKVPIICVIIGEGGSGGALGVGIADRILMLEHAYYSVISPEGCAAILFHDASKSAEAAESLKLTAQDLLSLGVIDEIIPEPLGGAHRDPKLSAENIKNCIDRHLKEIRNIELEKLLKNRYKKYRKIGVFQQKQC